MKRCRIASERLQGLTVPHVLDDAEPDHRKSADLSFNDFLINLAPIVVVIMIVFLAMARWLFRDAYHADPASIACGNAAAIGASANVVAIGLAKRNGHHISFWAITRYGAVVAVASVADCVPYLWFRYLA